MWPNPRSTYVCHMKQPSQSTTYHQAGMSRYAGGKWRLNGELSISRALGDLPYRQHGLSAEPEFSRWISLGPALQSSSQPHWLILATDGLFEGCPLRTCATSPTLSLQVSLRSLTHCDDFASMSLASSLSAAIYRRCQRSQRDVL